MSEIGEWPAPSSAMPAVIALVGTNVGYAFLQWLLFLLVARNLGSTAVGDLTLGMSVAAPAFVLGSLQLRMLMVTDARLVERLRHYARVRSWSGLAAVAVSVAVAALVVRERRVILVCALVAMCKYIELWGDLAGAVYQAGGRLARMVVSQTARGILAVAAVALAGARGSSLASGLALWLGFWCAFVFSFDGRALRATLRPADAAAAPFDDGGFPRATALAGGALGIAAFLNSVAVNLPRIWLARQASMEALGEFGVVAYVIAAASVVLGAGVLGVAPSFSLRFREGDRRRSVLLTAAVASALASAVAALVFWQAGALVSTLLGPAFHRSAGILRIVIWALPFYAVATTGNAAAVAERRWRQQLVAYAVTLAVTAAALVFGRDGDPAAVAAHALVLGSAVQAVAVIAGLRLGRSGLA